MLHHACLPRSFATPGSLELLLEGIARGEEAAFSDLDRLMRRRVEGYVARFLRNPFDAEEVAQEVLRYIWINADQFLMTRSPALAWIFLIARCRALDQMRRRQCRKRTVPVEDVVLVATGANPEVACQQAARDAQLAALVGRLPANKRELLRLAFYEGLSHQDVAKRTGLPLGTVKTRIRSALIELRSAIG